MKKRLVFFVAGLVLAAGGVAWVERAPLLTRYYVYRLAAVAERDREAWVERVVSRDVAAVPALLRCLERDRRDTCGNARQALLALAECWRSDDPRSAELAGKLTEGFAEFSGVGRQCALDLMVDLLRSSLARGQIPPSLMQAATQVLAAAAEGNGPVRGRAVELAALLLARADDHAVLTSCRKLASGLLHDPDADNRLSAIRLALGAGMDMLGKVVPLLDDVEPRVRCAALVAVGNAEAAIATDDLLRWLHDPDADVRRLCESALRGRGLTPAHVRLGRLLTDGRPAVRLQILAHLQQTDLEPGVWLRRLSHDPDPAVRTAAIRAATEQHLVDLTDRIEQISRNDPNPTVRQIAQYYLFYQRPRSLEAEAN